ncbi:hypothetical protein MKZ38_010789 [Zalerion maritima]|uniref:Uncharacterized protein n=1 Tax=Zalerion maritima TaxID=339359 RepID=A0AAD5S085_9PEZI|nr:hypothetical protein MKZ38_010789 [Zalerion maritima]
MITGPETVETDLDRAPFTFHHEKQHFTPVGGEYPRVMITQQLLLNNPEKTSSPATLWTTGPMHSITLNGTEGAQSEEMSRESGDRLKTALELLKDMWRTTELDH